MADDVSRLDRLRGVRDVLEAALHDDPPATALASIAREHRATLAEIAELEPVERRGDGVDEIAQRRTARRERATKGAARSRASSQ